MKHFDKLDVNGRNELPKQTFGVLALRQSREFRVTENCSSGQVASLIGCCQTMNFHAQRKTTPKT